MVSERVTELMLMVTSARWQHSGNTTTYLSVGAEKSQVKILFFSYCAPVSQIWNIHYGSWVILKNSTVLSKYY